MKKSNFYLKLLCILCGLMLNVKTSFAQNTSIVGKVLDAYDQPIISATVILKGTSQGSAVDLEGNFKITNISAGTYQVMASFVGYKSQTQEVTVAKDQTLTLDFKLTEDPLDLGTIVVTGTYNPQSKLESSVSVTTLNSNLIEQQAPRNTGDIIDAIPGFYVESNAGETNINVYPRGLPIGTGGFRYVGVREDGLPTFEIPDKVFFGTEGYTRVDLTLESIEGLRGGNASIFSSNTPAGIINFRSKTGGPEAKGEVKLTYGSQGMFRTDANFGGSLTADKKWRYNIGGFYRYDEGLRDFTGPANIGGQVKMNITRLLDNDKGYFRIYGKVLQDDVTFWTAVPYTNNDNPTAIAGGPGLTNGTLIPSGERDILIPDGRNPGSSRQVPFGPNARINYRNIGTELKLNLGDGWTLLNQTRYIVGGQNSSNILVTDIPRRGTLGLPAGILASPTFVAPVISYANPTIVTGNGTYSTQGGFIDPNMLSADGNILSTGINGNGLAASLVMPTTDLEAKNFINNLQITKMIADKHHLTLGAYVSQYDIVEHQNFNLILTDVRSNPRLLNASYSTTAGDTLSVVQNGLRIANFRLEDANTTNLTYAGFVGYEGSFGNLNVNAGLRLERNNAKGSLRNTDRAGASDTFRNDFLNYDFDHEVWNASLGLNYKLNEDMALFANASRGTRYSSVQSFISNKDQPNIPLQNDIEEILQGEIGYRVSASQFGLTASLFVTNLRDTPVVGQVTDENGGLALRSVFFDARTIGGEIEAVYAPIRGLRFGASLSLQDASYTNYSPLTVFDFESNDNLVLDFSGNKVERIPALSFDLTGSYNFSNFNVYISWRYVGERWGNRRNTYKLGDFSEFGLGASYTANQRLKFAIQVINLFDSEGLIQGNSRTQDSISEAWASDPTRINIGEFIFPRSANFSVHYSF